MGVFTSGYSLVNPVGLAFGSDGSLYVADELNIVKFDGTTGAFVSGFVATGSGGLLGPSLIAFWARREPLGCECSLRHPAL